MTHPGEDAFARLVRQADSEARVVLETTLDAGEMLETIKRRAARAHATAVEAVERQMELHTVGATLARAFSGPVQLEERPVVTAATLRPSDGVDQFRAGSYSELSTDFDSAVSGAVEGDPRAVEALLQRVRPLVVRYCRARLGHEGRSFALADDVAQEVCLAVLTALPTYRDRGTPFLAFLYGIAAHKVAQVCRGDQGTETRSDGLPSGASKSVERQHQQELQGELSQKMAWLLTMLPSKQREILVLRVVVGLSAEETADSIGTTPGAVRIAQHLALNTLRKVIDQQAAD